MTWLVRSTYSSPLTNAGGCRTYGCTAYSIIMIAENQASWQRTVQYSTLSVL